MALKRWGGLRLEPYDGNAVDADGDGIVQEGTAWERPVGTGVLDEMGRAITRGATSERRPRGTQVVDRAGNKIDYKPSYGDAPEGGRAGRQTPLAKQGFRSLSEMGMPTVGDLSTPAPRQNAPTPPVSRFDESAQRLFKAPTSQELIQKLSNEDQYEYNWLQRALEKTKSLIDDPEEQQFISGTLLNAFYWSSVAGDRSGTITNIINDFWYSTQDANFNPHQVAEDMWRSGGAFLISLPLLQMKQRYNLSKEQVSEIAFNIKSWMDQKKIQAGELSDKTKAKFKEIVAKVDELRARRDSKVVNSAEEIIDIFDEIPEAQDTPEEKIFKTADGFKRGKRSNSQKDESLIPIAGVGLADTDGFLEHRRIMNGALVNSPIDGSEKRLNSLSDSVEHIASGGALSEIPDEHLIRAIFENTSEDDNSRFKTIGTGGGINGMTRLSDSKTGALIGIKYEDGKSHLGPYQEAKNEILSELVSEHMGYEPMPMRMVPATKEQEFSWGKLESATNVALVSELAHNRYSGSIESARISDRNNQYDYRANMASQIKMAILDMSIGNKDRHEGNFLIARQDDGNGEFIPIDHSIAMQNPIPATSIDGIQGALIHFETDMAAAKIIMDGRKEELENIVSEIQQDVRSIDADKLNTSAQSFFTYMSSLGFAPSPEDRQSFDAVLQNIKLLSEATPEQIVEKIFPDWKMKLYESQIQSAGTIEQPILDFQAMVNRTLPPAGAIDL